jgi:ribosomal protein L40E/chromosome segregation ATPase
MDMALKVHLTSGEFVCPKCGATVKESDEKCPKCGTVFEGVKQGKKCPECGTINDIDAVICSACGYTFKDENNKKSIGKTTDEEFLQKLLSWGKSLAEQEEEDYQEEAEMVVNVFKKVAGINLDTLETEEEGEDWEKRIKRVTRFLKSIKDIVTEEKGLLEKKMKAARKQSTKDELKEQIEVLDKEIKGIERSLADLEDTIKSVNDIIKREEDKSIEKERMLRREIANIKKGSMKREEDLRAHINELNAEINELRKRIGESSNAQMMLGDWLAMEKRLEEELTKMGEKEKDEKTSEFIYQMEKEMQTLLSAVKMRIEEENELRRILKVLDDLLENLPDRVIEEFARSEDFKLYERVLDRYHVGE